MSFKVKFGTREENAVCLPMNQLLRQFEEDPESSEEAFENYIAKHDANFPVSLLTSLLRHMSLSRIKQAISEAVATRDALWDCIVREYEKETGECAGSVIELVDIISIDELLRQLDDYFQKEISEAAFADIMERYAKCKK